MRCGILSHVENVLVKINLKVESREKRGVYTQFLYMSSGAVFSTAGWQILNFKKCSLEMSCIMVSSGSYRGMCDEKGRAKM